MEARWEKAGGGTGQPGASSECHVISPRPWASLAFNPWSPGVQIVPGYRVLPLRPCQPNRGDPEPREVTCMSDLTEEEEQQVAE